MTEQEKKRKRKEMLKEVPTAGKEPLGYASDWNTCNFKSEERQCIIFLVILLIFVVCLLLGAIGLYLKSIGVL